MSKMSLFFKFLLSISFLIFYSCEIIIQMPPNNDSTVGCDMLIIVDSSRGECSETLNIVNQVSIHNIGRFTKKLLRITFPRMMLAYLGILLRH